MGMKPRSTPRQLARLVDEVAEAGLDLSAETTTNAYVLNAIDYALRPDVHEKRIPSFGAMIAPTKPEHTWGEKTGLEWDVRRPIVHAPDLAMGGAHYYADGLATWVLLEPEGEHAAIVLDRAAGSERDLVVMGKATGATIVQRHPAGLVRIVGSHGVLRWDGMRWHHEPPIWSWIDTITGFPGDGQVMTVMMAFALHDLGARGIGATLIYRPDESPQGSWESRLAAPPKLRITHPPDLAPLRHALAQIDGATIFDSEGTIQELGVRLIPSYDAESSVDDLKGMRHTSARQYSFDDPKATVIVVSEDGPVTVLRGGDLIGASPSDPLIDPID